MNAIDALLDLALDPCPEWQPRSPGMQAVKDMLADGRWHWTGAIARRSGNSSDVVRGALSKLMKRGIIEAKTVSGQAETVTGGRQRYWRLRP